MPELRGLAGVGARALQCRVATSRSEAIRHVTGDDRATTAAGADGAINVWRDDYGKLRSMFCRYLRTVDEAQHGSVASLQRWLRVWWPRMERFDAD